MDWSPGLSMGDFVSINYKNATLISNLQEALKNAFYVFEKKILLMVTFSRETFLLVKMVKI